MKSLLLLISIAGLYPALNPQSTKDELGLPELNIIKSATLSPNYGCRSEDDFRSGYANTALFLSQHSHVNSPDLLFNGSCGGEDWFVGSTGGDEMSLIADLGNVPLEETTASKAFNWRRIHVFDSYSKFAQAVRVETGHTYALLINKRDVRGLFVFSVVNYEPNKKVELRYAVKEYEIISVSNRAGEFRWDAKNANPPSNPE